METVSITKKYRIDFLRRDAPLNRLIEAKPYKIIKFFDVMVLNIDQYFSALFFLFNLLIYKDIHYLEAYFPKAAKKLQKDFLNTLRGKKS